MEKCCFCKNIKMGMPNWTFGDEELPTFKNADGIAIEIRQILENNSLVFTNSADEYGCGYININYCPICGRDLKVVENGDM